MKPMLASSGRPAGDLENWAVEMKWDGVRALAYCENGVTRLVSRTGRDITGTYPELGGLAEAIGSRQVLLDGEIVAFGKNGMPEFEVLQSRMHVRNPTQAEYLSRSVPVTFMAFDVLQLDGRDLTFLPYEERREVLELLVPAAPRWLCPPSFPGPDLDAVLEASAGNGLEGVMVKRLDSRYDPGARSARWLKVKNQLSQEVVVAGWKPGKSSREGLIGSLIAGIYDDSGSLVYCGHVGTGFTDEALRMLTAELAPLQRPDSPFSGPVPQEHVRSSVWAEPRLVIEVSFQCWTQTGRMRNPSYRGLRNDKNPSDVVRET